MSLAEGLYVEFPEKDEFVYPAGDKICPTAIGRIMGDKQRTPFPLGYITEVKPRNKEVKKGSGYWIMVKIIQAAFNKERQGWVDQIVVILRRKGKEDLIRAIMITAEVFAPDLFEL